MPTSQFKQDILKSVYFIFYLKLVRLSSMNHIHVVFIFTSLEGDLHFYGLVILPYILNTVV